MGYTIKHKSLSMTFEKDCTAIRFDHIPDPVVTADTGESAIQNLIQEALMMSRSVDDLQLCMESIREFYSHYLMDKSALNTLAFKLKWVAENDKL